MQLAELFFHVLLSSFLSKYFSTNSSSWFTFGTARQNKKKDFKNKILIKKALILSSIAALLTFFYLMVGGKNLEKILFLASKTKII